MPATIDSPLTPKQQLLADHYLVTLEGVEAARLASYKGDAKTLGVTAARTIAKPHVAAYIAERQARLSERTQLTTEWVLNNLREVAERCMEARPVVDSRGRPIEGEWTFDSKGANTALGMIGRHLGMFPAGNVYNMTLAQQLVIPPGTTLDDLKRLRDALASGS